MSQAAKSPPRGLRSIMAVAVMALVLMLNGERAYADWSARLKVDDPEALYAAIVACGEKGPAEAAGELLEAALRAEHLHLATACGDALAAMQQRGVVIGLTESPAFKKRIERLTKQGKAEEQVRLARVLGAWAPAVADRTLALLTKRGRPESVRIEALFSAGWLKATADRKLEHTDAAIRESLEGRSEPVQCAACAALARRGLGGSEAQLIKMVNTAKRRTSSMYAVYALRRLGWDDGVSVFLSAKLAKEARKGRAQAQLKAIARLSSLKDTDALLKLSTSPVAVLRDAALLGLARLAKAPAAKADGDGGRNPWRGVATPSASPPPDVTRRIVRQFIKALTSDDDYRVRAVARQGLFDYGELAREEVTRAMPRLLKSKKGDIALDVMEICGRFGLKAAYAPTFKTATKSKDPTVRMVAARALEAIDAEATVATLGKAIKGRRKLGKASLAKVWLLGYIRTRSSFDLLVDRIGGLSLKSPAYAELALALERLTRHRFGPTPDTWKTWIKGKVHPFVHKHSMPDRSRRREAVNNDAAFGISEATEKAVSRGLRWLQSVQRATGQWDPTDDRSWPKSGFAAAHTAGCLLAFLGAGYSPERGRYRYVVSRARGWLIARQHYDGGFRLVPPHGNASHHIYIDGAAIWGLCEAEALAPFSQGRESSKLGLAHLGRVQSPGAGWRYNPRDGDSDTSCTVWCLMALKAGGQCGLASSQRVWDGIDHWLWRCSSDVTPHLESTVDLSDDYGYEVGARQVFVAGATYKGHTQRGKQMDLSHAMTAAVMVARFFMGWGRSHPFMVGGANFLMREPPDWASHPNRWSSHPHHYDWYYGTLAMHQMGGRFWRVWNGALLATYPAHQANGEALLRGSWQDDDGWSGGRYFGTVFSLLMLESYYRYSPLMNLSSGEDPK